MARMARVVVPGHPHHVTQRGDCRQKTFFNDQDYQHYIELVARFAREFDTQVWACCLVPNHVHLVMVPAQVDGLRAPLGEAHRRDTRMVNFRQGWRGHLWQERFRSFVLDQDYLLATVRHVERNPVVAHLCRSPGDWGRSCAAARLRAEDDALVQVTPMLAAVESLSEQPGRGRRVPDAGRDDVRELLFHNYRIIYLLRADRLLVVTVVHGSRDLGRRAVTPWEVS